MSVVFTVLRRFRFLRLELSTESPFETNEVDVSSRHSPLHAWNSRGMFSTSVVRD